VSGARADELREHAARLRDRLVSVRRAIHENPELGLDTPLTQQRIAAELDRIGVRTRTAGTRCTSIVADIEGTAGSGDARCVALRADMDALPVQERTGVEYASKVDGRMHACGHDAHVAMLLGAAELLQARRDRFHGRVRLLFQPGEEGYGGAKVMIEEGALAGVERAFAIHLDPSRKAHTIAYRSGPVLAAYDNFTVVFRGLGGHASTPHRARDPIPAIGPFVDGLSHVAARETDPDDRVVYSVTYVRAGTTDNVVPADATCIGTFRSLSPEARTRARERVRRVAEGVAASRGLEVSIELVEGYPPTRNHGDTVEAVAAAARALGLPEFRMPTPWMGAEDFAYMLEQVPGALVFLGARTEAGSPLHSDVMRIDEDVLVSGAALHALVALQALDAG